MKYFIVHQGEDLQSELAKLQAKIKKVNYLSDRLFQQMTDAEFAGGFLDIRDKIANLPTVTHREVLTLLGWGEHEEFETLRGVKLSTDGDVSLIMYSKAFKNYEIPVLKGMTEISPKIYKSLYKGMKL